MSGSSDKLFGGNVRATGFSISSPTDSGDRPLRKMALTRLDIDGVEGDIGALQYCADEISLDGLQGMLGRGQIAAQAADIAGLSLRSERLRADIRTISCASGALSAGVHELVAPHVSFEDVQLQLDLSGLLARKSPDEDEPPVDLRFLDALQGQLDIDLAVDMTLPWLKRRNVTHYFRVPIVDGTIDYERLEDDVHWLEAAFLTIEQDGERLVLARDLPLVPYSGKELLWWQLQPEDMPVADLRRVHLRNLMRPRQPASKRDPGKKKLVLHELALQNIKLALHADRPVQISLPGGAMVQFGDDDSAGLSGLTLTGELRHTGARPGDDLTSLIGSLELLDVTLQDLPVGSATVSIDRLHISSIDRIALSFEGFRPRRLDLSIGRMAATNLRVLMG